MEVVTLVNHVLHPIICILCAFGNILVISSVIKFHWIRTPTNLYVLLLAFFDFMMGIPVYIAVLTQDFILETYGILSVRYEIICKTIGVLGSFASFGDLMCILIIAVERFLYINFPLRYETIHTMTRAKCVCILCVFCSLTFGFGGILSKPFDPKPQCMMSNLLNGIFLYYILFPLFILSFLIIIILYGKTTYIACKTRKDTQRFTLNSNNNNSVSQMRITKVLCLVIGVYAVTNLVYSIGVFETENMFGSSALWIHHILVWIWEVRFTIARTSETFTTNVTLDFDFYYTWYGVQERGRQCF